MSELEKRVTAVEQKLEALQTAVAHLSQQQTENNTLPTTQTAEDGIDYALLQRLQNRSGEGFEDGNNKGAVVYAGTGRLGGQRTTWFVERPAPWLLTQDTDQLAKVLAVLGHSARLIILYTLLEKGDCTNNDLLEALGGNSVGQLYHHLKELQGIGLVQQPRRGLYSIKGQNIIPFLAIMAASLDIFTDTTDE